MSGVISVAILPDVWCYVSSYPARYLALSSVMSVAMLTYVWCGDV